MPKPKRTLVGTAAMISQRWHSQKKSHGLASAVWPDLVPARWGARVAFAADLP